MEENGTVYLLYEGDNWLSRDSLVLMGIFSSEESLYCNAEKLIRERGEEHLKEHLRYDGWDFDEESTKQEKIDLVVEDILLELMSQKTTNGWGTNYYYQAVELDVLEEI